jgi:hypothetical protein
MFFLLMGWLRSLDRRVGLRQAGKKKFVRFLLQFRNMAMEQATAASMNVGSTTATSTTAKQVPHYMLPNWTSLLPNYSNGESDRIREAFSAGNHAAISKLPKKLE